jgi:phosphatidate cytidylyltransferase
MWVLALAAFGVAIVELRRMGESAARLHPQLNARDVVGIGLAFVGLGLLWLVFLRSVDLLTPHGSASGTFWLLLVLLPTWAADVVAYLLGSSLGRRKLAPAISPGKTWEGSIAGSIAAALVVVVMGQAAGIGSLATVFVALLIGPVGVVADLFESGLKRMAGVKDSGGFLPGHGGLLDRIDSLMGTSFVVLLGYFLSGAPFGRG